MRPDLVHYEGPVPHERVPSILKAADVAVAPYLSSAPEYFCPLKVVEAQAAGCPLLASRTRPVTDMAEDGERVRLFRPGDTGDFVVALEDLLADAPKGERSAVPHELSWASKAQRVVSVLQTVGA